MDGGSRMGVWIGESRGGREGIYLGDVLLKSLLANAIWHCEFLVTIILCQRRVLQLVLKIPVCLFVQVSPYGLQPTLHDLVPEYYIAIYRPVARGGSGSRPSANYYHYLG